MELLLRRATLKPETLDEEARTVRVIWTTGAPVQRNGFVERLDPAGADLSRLVGAPVLNSHRRDSLDDVLGVVVEAGVANGEGWASVKLSERADPIFRDIKAGIIHQVSVGYTVEEWREEISG
jgi:hypothetical protein